MATTPLELRPHQKEAVGAAVRVLAQHPRTSVIAACGTGKTLIAARTTARTAPRGRVLVLLPTLDLLSQTIRSWRLAGRKGTAIAVCSARQALDHEPVGADVPMTTDPGELTAHIRTTGPGPVTVYATYASLTAVITAHRCRGLFDLVSVGCVELGWSVGWLGLVVCCVLARGLVLFAGWGWVGCVSCGFPVSGWS
ncbi:DEAD/DEAH box helicase family protein [Streptomyces xanthochromogenes]|uniref:DEAD/DEAH box helicase family protein n=1 Tax=Streptomyces xanthochromogenes TaxID=67384 RepID=UPI001E2F7700|nr:DEAD/DEAH box helicase family protein [Streptomyces xanthochromogenes]